MAVTMQELADYIGVASDDPGYTEVQSCLDSATTLLDDVLSDAWRTPPQEMHDRWTKELGMEFWKRRDSVSGNSQYADFSTGQPVLGPRDPMNRLWPSIRRYVEPF